MSKSGSSERATPLRHDHRLLHQHELRLGLHVEAARRVEQYAAAGRAIERSRTDLPKIGSPMAAQRLGESLQRMMRRHEADVEMDLRHALVVARQEPGQGLGHEPAHGPVGAVP